MDISKALEIDLDEREDVSQIRNIYASKNCFYVLANKKSRKLGYYLFTVNIEKPDENSEYLINWNNKLDINNCNLQVLDETVN